LRVLLVEDDDAQADFVIDAISGAEYAATRTVRLQEALHELATKHVDVVLLDLTLPDAFDLRGVKAIRLAAPNIPLIVLTGSTDPSLGSRVMAAGADDYLQKDQVDANLLVRSIRYSRERHAYLEGARRLVTLAELNEKLEQCVEERTAKIEASEAALQVAARNKDEFLATLAHELRTPLVPLRTGLDLLLQNPASPVVDTTLTAMNRQLDHMVRLIDDLLDVARISHGTLELKKERADIATIIENAIDTCRPLFDKRRQSISVDVPWSMFPFVDPTRVSQILGNLLHNAAKYTPEGGEVRVELAHESGNAIVRIIDYGAGITAELIVRIFDMFVHVDHSQPSAGLGIGLALARRLAELHGGALVASSAGAGRGSTFTLSLPLVEEPQERVSHDRESPERRPDVAMLNIVVIEDNNDSADILALWLESHGHRVSVARTGPAGLELVKATRPDVVLCDIGLPGMDGVEVCRCVRGLSIDFRPVMVALSGWGREQDRKRTAEAGFDHHFVKPVAIAKLHALLESVLVVRRDLETRVHVGVGPMIASRQ
jgi:signal transduction histidine kinase